MAGENQADAQDGVGPIILMVDGVERRFDIDDPELPGWVSEHVLSSGGYPHDKKMKKRAYAEELEHAQEELSKLQAWLQQTGERVMVVFEGRDAAGKGGTIAAMRQFLNPRSARNVALPKPSDTERGQWYFQRYVAHFPTAGEFVTFDRSWYNRAGVEPVMGFCTPDEHHKFLQDVPQFELAIVNEGVRLFKFWLNVGRETQLKRFHDRRHSKLKGWKFSAMDVAGISRWDDYSRARDLMLERTHTAYAPWMVIRSNDKRRARLAAIRHVLGAIPYAGRDMKAVGAQDPRVICEAPAFLSSLRRG